MSLAHAWFCFEFDPQVEDVLSPLIDVFFGRLVDPKSIQLLTFSLPGEIQVPPYLLPGSLPPNVYDAPLFDGELFPRDASLSKLASNPAHLDVLSNRDSLRELWNTCIKKNSKTANEVSLRCWGLTYVFSTSAVGLIRDWFLMERIALLDDAVRVPVLELELRMNVPRPNIATFSVFSHARVWSEYDRPIRLSRTSYEWVRKEGDALKAAEQNVKALGSAIRAYIESASPMPINWYEESSDTAPDLASLLRRELIVQLGPSVQELGD